MEGIITISLAIAVPSLVSAIRPTRAALATLLAIGLGYATVRLALDDWHPTQLDDLAWAAIVYGAVSALIVGGWLVGRIARRRARSISAGPA